jgi:hypothetical protein
MLRALPHLGILLWQQQQQSTPQVLLLICADRSVTDDSE